ncbi:MAG: acyl-CoA synthetase, partial [Alphaproteobacteria bacterium]
MGHRFATLADKEAIEREMPWEERQPAPTLYRLLADTAARHPERPALSFQLTGGPKDRAETFTWRELLARVTQAANLFRSLGVGERDVVAYLLPNANETAITLLGGAIAGIVNPINPLLEPEQIAAILRETGAKVLVTLRSFPRSDVAQKAAAALEQAPGVHTLIEVDLKAYMAPPVSWLVPLLRPKLERRRADLRVLEFRSALAAQPADALTFPDAEGDRVAAYFHTGGTTGMPKVAQHRYSGMIYNGWCAEDLLIQAEDVLLCPLPLFHVFAAYPVLMAAVASGAHMVMPTPQGYRGEGVFDNFWKLVERWGATFMVTVPTAVAQLMQRPVDADVSSLKMAICGSAPLPVELFNRFQQATGVEILEGYGMTEATCLISANPAEGVKKVGSV